MASVEFATILALGAALLAGIGLCDTSAVRATGHR